MKNRVAFVLLAVLALLAPAVEATAEQRAPTTVRIGVPEPTNPQFMTFWLAVGAGYFENNGLDVEVVAPPMPAQTPQQLLQGQIDAAVLMAPLYLGMIADEHPVKLFQNLLTNDPVNLVVDRDLAVSPTAPLATRLGALRGLRIGVAENASARTRVLFESVGMDPDEDVEIVEPHGPDQIPAFTSEAVDALHTMVTTDAYLANNGRAVTGMKAAVYRAQRLLLTDPDAALQAVRNAGLDPPRLETIVDLYSRAVPLTLSVAPDSVVRTAGLFVGRPNHPDFSRIDVNDYLA